MNSHAAHRLPVDWEGHIEAFEAAYASTGQADIRQFLPDSAHPDRMVVLLELVRIDLEYHWRCGQTKWIEEYRRSFPELFDDASALYELAFEEYRLRRQAGEEPSPAEYQGRIGMPIGFWPRPQRPNGTDARLLSAGERA